MFILNSACWTGCARISQSCQTGKRTGNGKPGDNRSRGYVWSYRFLSGSQGSRYQPIIGCEMYVAQKDHTSRIAAEKNNYHLVLLAKNLTGYRNLLQLTTRAHLEGFYYKPRVDHALLEQYHEGLIALNCMYGGRNPQSHTSKPVWWSQAECTLGIKKVFGDFYLEIQRIPTGVWKK